MKNISALLILILLPLGVFAQQNTDSLLKVLDETVDNYQFYSDKKEDELNKLKVQLKSTRSDTEKYDICGQLYNNYSAYKSDSALVYAWKKLAIAERLNNKRNLADSRLNLAAIMSINGMYKESMDLLNTINIEEAPDLKAYYFHIT